MDITNINALFPVQTTRWSNLEISSSPMACHSIILIWAYRRDVFSQVSQSQHASKCWSLNAKWTEGNRFSSSSVVLEAGGSYLIFNSVSVCSRFGWDAVIAANMVLCFKFVTRTIVNQCFSYDWTVFAEHQNLFLSAPFSE